MEVKAMFCFNVVMDVDVISDSDASFTFFKDLVQLFLGDVPGTY